MSHFLSLVSKYFHFKLVKKKHLIIFLKNNVIKIPFSYSSFVNIKKEINCYHLAKKSNFWGNVFVKTNFYVFFSYSIRCINQMHSYKEEIKKFLDKQLLKTNDLKKSSALQIIDTNSFFEMLEKNKVLNINDKLSEIFLPIGQAHGDLHLGNFLYLNNHLVIIDWGSYKEKSSFLFDYVHFYVREASRQKNKSWTEAVIDEDFVKEFSLFCEKKIQLNITDLLFAYSINRVILEIIDLNSYNNLNKNKIEKYNKFINILLSENL